MAMTSEGLFLMHEVCPVLPCLSSVRHPPPPPSRPSPTPALALGEGRPLLSGWLVLYREGGGGSEAKKKFANLKSTSKFRAPVINFLFFPRKSSLMWRGWGVGGGSAEVPRGPLYPLPPAVALSNGLAPGGGGGRRAVS